MSVSLTVCSYCYPLGLLISVWCGMYQSHRCSANAVIRDLCFHVVVCGDTYGVVPDLCSMLCLDFAANV
jgi:hypothetical protein